ncbi:MAG: ArnT family glycosyltransferase [Chthoniobacteraceae bacterium]
MPSSTQLSDRQITGTGCSKQIFWSLCIAVLLLSSVLLFARLGHYALWDDETGDALSAESVLQTGDTKAFVGHNIIGYDHGGLLAKLRCEADPPFVAYTAALSMRIFGINTFAARLPFALFGLACVGLMFRWMWKWKASTVTVAVFSVVLITNVSFFLYSRQCHYYGAAMLFSMVVAYIYTNWRGDILRGGIMGICLALLMSTNPCFFISICMCLLVDYLIWQRKINPVRWLDLAVVLLPSLVMGLIMLQWWNPFHCELAKWLGHNSHFQQLILFLWYCRDVNQCEMLMVLLVPFAIVASFVNHITPLKRGLVAILVDIVAMTLLSNQIVNVTNCADIRFLSNLIPLFIAVEVFTLCWLVTASFERAWVSIPVAILAFGSNLFYGAGLITPEDIRSSLYCFARELWNPPSDPYSETSKWIRKNVQKGESVWVQPAYATGPLMFHAPDPLYAWQLLPPPQGQFAKLALIHFAGILPPDYMVAFGPNLAEVKDAIQKMNDADKDFYYRREAVINYFWRDLYRPELFWRRFESVRNFNPEIEAIYVFKRVPKTPLQ